jgi:hypothetical protein
MVGAGRKVAEVIGVVMVKVREFEGPVAVETETDAVPKDAVSEGRIAAVTCVVLINVVTRGEPFQFTVVAPFIKFVRFTVSVIPFGWQYGVDDVEVEDAKRGGAIVGNSPGTGLTVKLTTFDTSVVVVAVVPEAPETAEPGIWTVTCAVPAVAISEAGTVAVSWLALTIRVGS